MKKLGILILALISLHACKNSNTFEIVATVNGIEAGKEVFVRKLDENNQLVVIDTLEIKEGKFVYKGIADIPNIHYFFIQDARGRIPVIIEPGTITVTAYKDSLNAAVVEGTPSNKDFNVVTASFKEVMKKMGALRSKMLTANREKDSAAMEEIKEDYSTLRREALEFQKSFVKENPQSYVSAMLLKQMLFTSTEDIDVTEIQRMYDELLKSVKATKEAKEVSAQLYKIAKTAVGAVAPDFSGPNPEGELLALKDIKGKVTLIHFWESHCEACITETLNLKALYTKYHDKGLNIIGVSFDRKAEDWKKAITDGKLPWNHISNLKHFLFDSIAKTYNLKRIPATFILDAEGKIAAKNLDREALEAKIETLLAL